MVIGEILGIPTAIGVGTGLLIGIGIAFGASLTIGTAVVVGLGIAGGLVIGIIVSAVGYFFTKYKKRGKYKEALENSKSQLINKFKDVEYSFTDHFKTFKDTLISELKLKTEIYLKRINNDKSEWQKIQQEYEVIKKNTKQRIKNKFNFDI